MTNAVVLTVLLAALMHAFWNSLISRATDKGLPVLVPDRFFSLV